MIGLKGLALDVNGDIIIVKANDNTITEKGKQIQTIKDNELIAQKILIRIGTLIGEWFWNTELGINHDLIIGKNITQEMIKSQIALGVNQVDSSLYISDFKVNFDKAQRTADIDFTVSSNGEKVVRIEKFYGAEQGNLTDKLAVANAKITAYETSLTRLANRINGK